MILSIFSQPIQAAVLCLVTVGVYILLYLVMQALLPNDQAIIEQLFVWLFIALFAGQVIDAFVVMTQLISILQAFFILLLPLLSTMLVAVQALFSLVAWNPIIFFILQLLMFVCTKFLIPALIIALILDMCTRILPQISFSKAAELIRGTVLSVIVAAVITLTSVLSFTGMAFFQLNDAVKSPIKKLIEQNIPLIGGLIVEGFSLFQKTQTSVATLAGLAFLASVWFAAFYPALTLLIYALTFKVLGAVTEPFMNARLSGLFDDTSKTLLVLCAVGLLLGFTLVFIVMLCIVLVQLGMGGS